MWRESGVRQLSRSVGTQNLNDIAISRNGPRRVRRWVATLANRAVADGPDAADGTSPTRAQRDRHIVVAICLGVVATALLTVLLLPPPASTYVASFCAILAPLVAVLLLNLLRGHRSLTASPANILSVAYAIFFGAGYLEYVLNDRHIAFGVWGGVSSLDALRVLGATSTITVGLILGLSVWPMRVDASGTGRTYRDSAVQVTRHLLFAVVAIGVLQTIVSGGGVANVASTLQLHDKTANATVGGIGASLWSLFATPSLLLSGYAAASKGPVAGRVVGLLQFAALAAVALSIYGSRLTVVVALLAIFAARYATSGRALSVVALGAVLAAFLGVSFWVLSTRADAQSNTQYSTNGLDILSYSIFDVSVAASLQGSDLGPILRSPQRLLTDLSTALPRLGESSDDVNDARLDVVMAQQLGNQAQAESSGLPPSLPTFLWLAYGIPLGFLIGFVLAAVAGGFATWLLRFNGQLSALAFGLYVAFLFSAFEGGDVPLVVGTELRRWIYLGVIWLLIALVMRWASRGKQNLREMSASPVAAMLSSQNSRRD